MYNFRFFSKLFGIEFYNPKLYVAQYKNMARQTPWLYLIVVLSTIAVVFVFWGHAPIVYSLIIPTGLVIGDLAFMFWFIAKPKNTSKKADNFHALVRLHVTIWGSIVLGLSYAFWSIALFGFGDPAAQGLIAVFLGTTAFGASLCLMHLRVSAIALVLSVVGPFVVFLWLTGNSGYMASAFIITLVMSVFIYILTGYARNFSNLVKQQSNLAQEREKAEDLSRANFVLANEDSLTGLANRRCFMAEAHNQVNNVELGQCSSAAIGILDLDGFKLINDVYGHPVGDKILVEVGARLDALQCSRVFISRLGGDEFGIIVKASLEDVELIEIGEMICDAMRIPFDVGGQKSHLGGSVGFAKWASIADSAECLFEKADYALYHAKENARGGVTIFAEHHQETIREVRAVDRRMQDADFAEEMRLVFQPIVEPQTATTVGFEVLARWNSPILGFISPDVFIRSAERAGTINRLTAVLLEKALKEAKNWPQDTFMSFNLSMQDITSSEAMVNLMAIVNRSGFDPKRLTFEVTETSMMSDYDRAMDSLNLLKNMGCKIALDDFGTGYSSLSYVRNMPLDKLKLDRSFITEIETDEDACSIVHTMVEMCQSLKLDCIVEGVETRDQLGILSAMGVNKIQGYFFSKPMNARDTLAYILEERRNDVFEENPMILKSVASVS